MEASLVFKEAWEKAKTCEGYVRRKQEFLEKQNGQRIEQEPIDGEPNDRNMVRKRKRKLGDDAAG